ncbi:MAG: hypothetical protein IJ666_03500 [Ruminococcus sp.]|nr:hypothetical protein [Ruminococcus sp.]
MKKIPLNAENTKITGRTYNYANTLALVLSGSGCEFSFTGKRLDISISCDEKTYLSGRACNYPRIAIICDGRFTVKRVLENPTEKYNIISSDIPVTKNIKIIKLSEAAFSLALVHEAETDDNAVISPLPGKNLKIEFIGDSITCGYGVDNCNVYSEFSTAAENCMKSYAYLTADMLNADYSLFSYSGYGIISGYTPDGVRNTREVLPQYYESTGFSYGTINDIKPHEIKWDFSRFVPDIIVINLGTNDNSFCIKNEWAFGEFEDKYIDFLITVRKNNPAAKIICAIGMMNSETSPHVINAAERFGDAYFFEFKMQDGMLGFSCDFHPSEDTQRYAAEELTEFIKKII